MMLGELEDQKLLTKVIHRFPNRQIAVAGSLYWNILNVFENLRNGMRLAIQEADGLPLSLGIDSYCNDFGLIDRNGKLFNQVYCYRDDRTRYNAKAIYEKVSQKELYMETGSQTALFNTSMEMAAMILENDGWQLKECQCALMIPDLLSYLLTGQMHTEYTLASVTQLWNWKNNTWHTDIMKRLGIPVGIFPDVIPTGTIVGEVDKTYIPEIENSKIMVTAVAEHDTASAIAALPTVKDRVAYISSGTWSIVGTEVLSPILTDDTFSYNFAYEGGVDYRYRMIKNVMGMWILQECQRDQEMRTGQKYTYEKIDQEARQAESLKFLIDPDDDSFYMPGNMNRKVIQYCERTGQGSPESFGQIVRSVMESLAMKYRYTIENMERVLGYSLEEIHILGGGGQNRLLDQFVADACKKPVYTGLWEAGLLGNIIVQMRSSGQIAGLKEGRQIIRESSEIYEFTPVNPAFWDDKYDRFKKLLVGDDQSI